MRSARPLATPCVLGAFAFRRTSFFPATNNTTIRRKGEATTTTIELLSLYAHDSRHLCICFALTRSLSFCLAPCTLSIFYERQRDSLTLSQIPLHLSLSLSLSLFLFLPQTRTPQNTHTHSYTYSPLTFLHSLSVSIYIYIFITTNSLVSPSRPPPDVKRSLSFFFSEPSNFIGVRVRAV